MAALSPGRSSSEHDGLKILVVDDNADTVDTTADVLELNGYSAIPAYSAREAVDLLDEVPNIALVLSDIRMPEIDGFDLLRVLRHRFRSLPVILMSGMPITEDDIVPAGASVLRKPVDIDELLSLLREKIGGAGDRGHGMRGDEGG